MRWTRRLTLRCLWLLLIAVVSGMLSPSGGYAQVSLLPSVGVYSPLSDLLDVRDEEGMPLFEAGRKNSTLALGLAAELGSPAASWGARVQLGYATASEVPVEGVGCEDCELRSTLLTATAGVILRPFPELLILRPHLLLGGGVKRYGFDRDDLEAEGWDQVLRDQTQPTLHLAAGGALRLGIVTPRFEIGALISRIDGVGDESGLSSSDDLQTDLFLMVSIPLVGR
ncbi:MAG: hypothetical protein EA351_09055 [Gemmatimonadales bacterium]|nr:MAG: hypothetical protein EA351_09055 [Gemmatimonadales bacterium]